MDIKDVIIKPIFTEKSTKLTKDNIYVFEVNKKANKNQIKTTIEKIYNVKVGDINIVLRKGKRKRNIKKMTIKKTSDRKIAFVKLKEGKIDAFPQS